MQRQLHLNHSDISADWERHSQQKDVSYETYSRRQKNALGDQVLKKKRIYLDQKYWNNIGDSKRGASRTPEHARIYDLLRSAVESGRAICPASLPVLMETMRQQDLASRSSVASVVDELSSGVALLPPDFLSQVEFTHYFMSTMVNNDKLYARKQMAWTYIGFVISEQWPTKTPFTPENERILQKCMFDSFSRVTFQELADRMSEAPQELTQDDSKLQAQITTECKEHRNEYRTFKQVFMNEISGILDFFDDQITDAVRVMISRTYKIESSKVPEADIRTHIKEFRNRIYWGFENDKLNTQLPCLHIGTSIHAAKRFRHENFHKGDLMDFMHARMALPYCDVFLTEKNLANLLTQKPLALDQQYGCTVVWKESDAIQALEAAFVPQ